MTKGKVLIIDYNLRVIDVLKKFLLKNGYEVKWVCDLNTATAHVNFQPIDIIICNYGLMDDNTLDFYSEITKLTALSKSCCILMLEQGAVFTEAFWRAVEHGRITSFLFKPFSKTELSAVLDYCSRSLNYNKFYLEMEHSFGNGLTA